MLRDRQEGAAGLALAVPESFLQEATVHLSQVTEEGTGVPNQKPRDREH